MATFIVTDPEVGVDALEELEDEDCSQHPSKPNGENDGSTVLSKISSAAYGAVKKGTGAVKKGTGAVKKGTGAMKKKATAVVKKGIQL